MPGTPEIGASQSDARMKVSMVHPLDRVYELAGVPLPLLENISGERMPEPYRSLLVHERDMTPTLEAFWGSRIHLQVCQRQRYGEFYLREVLLRDGNNRVVEMGAIEIDLSLFPDEARHLILAEKSPLGRILHDCRVVHSSCPRGYFQVVSDERMRAALELEAGQLLYGRRNCLTDNSGRPLAQIVEILPPIAEKHS